MEYRHLGKSGFKVPALSLGTGTFGGQGKLFGAWGNTDVTEAQRLVDICLEAGLNLFDSADVYSGGASESILGAAIKGRRDKVLVPDPGYTTFTMAPAALGARPVPYPLRPERGFAPSLADIAPLLTRRQRVERARKQTDDLFSKYGETARDILRGWL